MEKPHDRISQNSYFSSRNEPLRPGDLRTIRLHRPRIYFEERLDCRVSTSLDLDHCGGGFLAAVGGGATPFFFMGNDRLCFSLYSHIRFVPSRFRMEYKIHEDQVNLAV